MFSAAYYALDIHKSLCQIQETITATTVTAFIGRINYEVCSTPLFGKFFRAFGKNPL